MNEPVRSAVLEQVTTLGEQFDNAVKAISAGDTSRLRKALSIMGKVVRVLFVVLDAIEDKPAPAKTTRKR